MIREAEKNERVLSPFMVFKVMEMDKTRLEGVGRGGRGRCVWEVVMVFWRLFLVFRQQ